MVSLSQNIERHLEALDENGQRDGKGWGSSSLVCWALVEDFQRGGAATGGHLVAAKRIPSASGEGLTLTRASMRSH